MKQMTIRGVKIFFKDKAGVFFSLLGVIIIFCLFTFFVGDSITDGLEFLPNARFVMNAWVVAGMLASCTITTGMGAYAVMVSDREQKTIKDFYSSPLKKSSVAGGYMCTGFLISVVMSVITLVFGEIYIVANGGELVDPVTAGKVLGVVLLSAFSSSAMVCFIISFVKTGNAYTTLSIILGTLIGFLVGAYIPMGDLPTGVQWGIQCFPCAHGAALFRQLLMAKGLEEGFADLPASALNEFREQIGVTFRYGDWQPEMWFHVAVLVGTGILFYLLAIINMSRKSRKC